MNPTVDEVLGEKSYASVTDIPEQVDVVDLDPFVQCFGHVVDGQIPVQTVT